MISNHVKQALRAGRPQFGTLLNIADPLVAELMAATGFDWLLVDTEHSPVDAGTLAAMLAVITRYPVAPLVRIPTLSEEHCKRALDAGAWGILAPNVRTAEEAAHLVRACRYPPDGVRSLGAGRFALSFRTDPATYFRRANQELLLIVQIEHADALRHLDAIFAVPGVDACYVGPNDLCASLGLSPALEPTEPAFEEAVQAVLAAARKHGVAPGIHCATPESANWRLREGWTLVGVLSDQRLLAQAARAIREAVGTGHPPAGGSGRA